MPGKPFEFPEGVYEFKVYEFRVHEFMSKNVVPIKRVPTLNS
jgi:hypothetical protein